MFINMFGWLNDTGGLLAPGAVEPVSVATGIAVVGVVLAVALGFIVTDALKTPRRVPRPTRQRLRHRAVHLVLIGPV